MKNQVDAIRSLSSENGVAHVLNSSLTKLKSQSKRYYVWIDKIAVCA
jgi:hypothetical protein